MAGRGCFETPASRAGFETCHQVCRRALRPHGTAARRLNEEAPRPSVPAAPAEAAGHGAEDVPDVG